MGAAHTEPTRDHTILGGPVGDGRTDMRIERTIAALEWSYDGYFLRVACNVNGDHMPRYEATYTSLSWTEVIDVLLAELDGRRPGWEIDEGMLFQQPGLWP